MHFVFVQASGPVVMSFSLKTRLHSVSRFGFDPHTPSAWPFGSPTHAVIGGYCIIINTWLRLKGYSFVLHSCPGRRVSGLACSSFQSSGMVVRTTARVLSNAPFQRVTITRSARSWFHPPLRLASSHHWLAPNVGSIPKGGISRHGFFPLRRREVFPPRQRDPEFRTWVSYPLELP